MHICEEYFSTIGGTISRERDTPVYIQGGAWKSESNIICENISPKPHIQTPPNLSCFFLMAVALCCFDGVAISYVLPVQWMTSTFSIMDRLAQARQAWCSSK